MVEARVPFKAAQECLGHSRPDILLKFNAHVLDASADMTVEMPCGQFGGRSRLPRLRTRMIIRAIRALAATAENMMDESS